jgi:hypothetical protein
MPIRQPVYLDLAMLENVADFLEVGFPVDAEIREQGTSEASGAMRAGIPGIPLRGEGSMGSSEAVETNYSVKVRPVRVMNDTIDAALREGTARDLDSDGNLAVSRRDLVHLTGELALAPVSELGGLLADMLPVMASSGALSDGESDIPAEAITAILGGDGAAVRPLLYELVTDSVDIPVYVHVDPASFHQTAGADDLVGEFTVFGVVDQLVGDNRKLDTVRYLMPAMGRAARRSFDVNSFDELFSNFGHAPETAHVTGPYWIVRPLAVF